MVATVFYLLMLQKYINSKQKILKQKYILCIYEIFQEIFQLITWKKIVLNEHVYDFSVDYRAFYTSNIIDIYRYLME